MQSRLALNVYASVCCTCGGHRGPLGGDRDLITPGHRGPLAAIGLFKDWRSQGAEGGMPPVLVHYLKATLSIIGRKIRQKSWKTGR